MTNVDVRGAGDVSPNGRRRAVSKTMCETKRGRTVSVDHGSIGPDVSVSGVCIQGEGNVDRDNPRSGCDVGVHVNIHWGWRSDRALGWPASRLCTRHTDDPVEARRLL